MNTDAAVLIDILSREKELYQELLELSKKEQEIIINRDMEGLSAIVKETEYLMLHVLNLQKKRFSLLGEEMDISLPKLPQEFPSIDFDDKSMTDKATELKDAMLSIVKDLVVINHTNTELLKRSIGYIEFLLGEVASEKEPTYSNKPNPQKTSPVLFDGKA